MELTTVLKAKTRVSVTYEEDGSLSVKVFAQAEYAPGRTTTAELTNISDEHRAELQALLKKIHDASVEKIGAPLLAAMAKSADVSRQQREIK